MLVFLDALPQAAEEITLEHRRDWELLYQEIRRSTGINAKESAREVDEALLELFPCGPDDTVFETACAGTWFNKGCALKVFTGNRESRYRYVSSSNSLFGSSDVVISYNEAGLRELVVPEEAEIDAFAKSTLASYLLLVLFGAKKTSLSSWKSNLRGRFNNVDVANTVLRMFAQGLVQVEKFQAKIESLRPRVTSGDLGDRLDAISTRLRSFS